ncbi:hypothetical protein BC827DRAFT_1247691 [Russula dissimulans]|nr:hypothetical protein BC827DRAFT_1247691 [Russula dissimulans]
MTTAQVSQSDPIHLVVDARNSYEPTVGIPVWSWKHLHELIMYVFQKSDLSATPAATEAPNNNPETTLSSLEEVTAPHPGAQKLEEQLGNASFKSQSDSMGILSGEDDISQTHVGQDITLQQDNLAPTRRVFNILHREVDYHESMQLHAELQSVVRRVVELESRLGAVRDNRALRRERIQLGLDVSVEGKRGVSEPAFPFMMVLLALIVVIIPSAYKYYAFSA